MNKRQIATLTMMKTVNTSLADNQTIWNKVQPLAEAANDLQTIIDDVEAQAKIQYEKTNSGYTIDKQNKLLLATEQALSLCMKIRPYARKTKKEVLLSMVDYSKTSLEEGSDIEVLNRCKTISDQAKKNAAALVAYMVLDVHVASLDQAIADVSPLTAKRDVIQDQRSQITTSLAQLFTSAHDTLSTLDDLIQGGFSQSHSDFVNTYFNSRKITDRTGRHIKSQSKAKPDGIV